jgi:hypothetical protein
MFFKAVTLASDTFLWSSAGKYPYGAISYIKENNLEGEIYNRYDWGGYLIWQLPGRKYFIDGRMPSWRENGMSVFEDYVNIALKPAENKDLFYSYVETYNIEYALLKRGSALSTFLLQDSWEVLYSDQVSLLLAKPI